jgi:Na+/H+ antiporter NhaD/arsenite permease-like protein
MASLYIQIGILIIFIVVVFLISAQKGNRGLIALGGATLTYFLLFISNEATTEEIIGFVVGTAADHYTNFSSILFILGLLTIVSIAFQSGLFDFLGFKLIQRTKGEPVALFITLGLFTIILSIIIDNYMVLLIVIPLTIKITKMLEMDPLPFILPEALLVNAAGTIISFSSVQNIIISNYADIPFLEFFIEIGLISIVISLFTLSFLLLLMWRKLQLPKKKVEILLSYEVWDFIPDRMLMIRSSIVLVLVVLSLIFIPTTLIPSELICLIGTIILILISRINSDKILKSIDFELLLYIISVFLITGALGKVGVVAWVAETFKIIGNSNPYLTTILVLWSSAFLSVSIDNVPMTQLLLPVVKSFSGIFTLLEQKNLYYALTMGIGWGDSLTPLGDNIVIMKLVEQNKAHIPFRTFFKFGFITGIFQMSLATVYFTFIQWSFIFALIIGGILCLTLLFYLRKKLPSLVRKPKSKT